MKHVDEVAALKPQGSQPRESVEALAGRLISGVRARAVAEGRGPASRGTLTRALLALTLLAVTMAWDSRNGASSLAFENQDRE